MLNKIILCGRICNDIDLKTTQSGVNVAQFRLAVERPKTSGGERKTDFITIVCWRANADFVSRFFHKGSRIIVEGSLQTREYTDKEGSHKFVCELVADAVYFVGPKEKDVPTSVTTEDGDLPF